jgi:hypothetical protein
VLSLYLAIPLAYVVFALLSVAEVDRGFMLLVRLGGTFCDPVASRPFGAQPPGSLLSHRVLVFGAARRRRTSVACCASRIRTSRSLVSIPAPTDTEIVVPAQVILSQEMSLSDTAHSLKVDEIIVAVRERRGGALPLRELLDCKLSGVKVLDLASYFERALGRSSRFAARRLADLW